MVLDALLDMIGELFVAAGTLIEGILNLFNKDDGGRRR